MDLILCLYVLLVLFLTLCAVVVSASVYFKYFDADGVLMAKVPAQRGVPIFHNAFDFLLDYEQLFQYSRKLYKEFKGIYGLSGFNYRYVCIFEPEDVEKILSSSTFNTKRFPYTFLQPWLGSGLLISNGEKWHERRKMLTPAFHFNILKKFQVNFNEQVENLLEILQKEVGKEKTDIFPIIAESTLQIICETSMGSSMREDIRTVTNKYFKSIHVLGECLMYRMSRIWFYAESTFRLTKQCRIQKAALNDSHKFTKQIIKERREFRRDNPITTWNDDEVYGKKNRMAMLDMLLEQEKLGKINEDGIREEVDTFLFEGHDTTATALCFMIMRIANEPVAQNLIYEELQRVLGDKQSPTMEDFNEMKYLDCCIKESLRLYPSVPYISRVTNENVELSGYTIPKSTEISLHIFDIHRQEHIYPEPEKFIPERFLPDNVAKRHPYAYIPFSAGPRNCIGQKYAMLELKTVMAAILRRFRLEPITRPEDVKFVVHLVLRASNPIYVRFIDRKSDVES